MVCRLLWGDLPRVGCRLEAIAHDWLWRNIGRSLHRPACAFSKYRCRLRGEWCVAATQRGAALEPGQPVSAALRDSFQAASMRQRCKPYGLGMDCHGIARANPPLAPTLQFYGTSIRLFHDEVRTGPTVLSII